MAIPRMAENGTIKQSKYIPRQMNGPVINAYGMAQEEEGSDAEKIIDYLHGLRIQTAQETELESLGCLIGYPRPITPEGFNQENLFLFGNLPISSDPESGFSELAGQIGGRFSTIQEGSDEENKMALSMYRKMLRNMARVKRYGITIKNVDNIAAEFDPDYELEWTENGDIKIIYANSIGFKNVWVLTQLFYRVCTTPQVIIQSGGTI